MNVGSGPFSIALRLKIMVPHFNAYSRFAFFLTVLMVSLGWMHVAPANAQDRSQGRSRVISRDGIVAAESPLAAQAGATILAHGGNAVDAIVAANAVMGVVEPMMNGMGGDLFAIVYDAKIGQALRFERQRLVAREAHHRIPEEQGHHPDAGLRDRQRHGAGRG